jgi:enolase-phosphatase E1
MEALILDVEGTLGSLSYVQDTLFPYASSHMKDYIYQNIESNPKVIKIIDEVLEIIKNEGVEGINFSEGEEQVMEAEVNTAIQAMLIWTKNNQKIKPLKDLQGMIWHEGCVAGDLKAHLYPDVEDFLVKTSASGVPIYIYSSGSVQAQKLYFKFNMAGDLTPYISGYYDTAIGLKQEAKSYLKIFKDLQDSVESIKEVVFISDHPDEIKAAKEAGMSARLIRRAEDYPDQLELKKAEIHSFSELSLVKS